MIKQLLFVFSILLIQLNLIAQCNFTPSIAASGTTNICGTGGVTLTAMPPGDTWTQKTNFSGVSSSGGVGFSIGSKGYMGLGTFQNDFWEYDPATNAWTQKANFPAGLYEQHLGFSIGSKGYVAALNGTTEVFFEYNPVGNLWTAKANVGGVGRLDAFAFSTSTKGYIGTGRDPLLLISQNDFWEYDPTTDIWTQKANYGGGARYSSMGFGIGAKGYVGVGYNSSNATQSDFWEYNPATDIWTQKNNYPGFSNGGNLGFGMGTKGFVLEANISFTTNFREYNPISDAWTARATFTGTTRSNAVAFSLGSKAYFGDGNHSDFWEYDASYTYSWNTSATTSSINVTGTGTYSVVMTSAIGCTAGISQTIAVTPYPLVSIDGPGSACSGNSTVLTGSGASSYTWSSNAGSVNTTTASVSPVSTSFYTLTGSTAFGCIATAIKPVVVVSTPAGTLLPAGSGIVCGSTLALSTNPAGDTWTQKSNLTSTNQYYSAGFSIGDKGYIGPGDFQNTFWEYNSVADSWTQKANFAGGSVSDAVGFAIGAKGYIAAVSGTTEVFWEYDPSVNVWTQKTNAAGGAGRLDASGFSIAQKGYLGLGRNPLTLATKNDFWEYDPFTDTWTQKANYSGGTRFGSIGFSVATKGYFGLGYNASTIAQIDIWEYTPTADTWTQKTNFPGTPGSNCTAFTIGTSGFVSIPNFSGNFWEYSPTGNAWTQKTSFPGNTRFDGAGFSIGGKGYFGLGSYSDFWEYDPTYTFSWSNGAITATTSISANATYSVLLTSILGCTTNASKAYTLNPLPIVTASATSGAICTGNTVTLNGGGASTYVWTNGVTDGSVFSPTSSTNYTVTGTAAVTGCTNSATQFVTVNSLPPVTANTTNSVICLGQTVTLTGGGATTYTWNGTTVNGTAFSPTSTATYTVTGKLTATGCTNTAVRTITVNNLPTVTAGSTQSVICLNATVTLNGGGASSYLWTGSVIDGAPFSPTITSTYTVTGTSVAGCTNTAVKSITVNGLPLVTASSSNSVICIGVNTSLSGGGAITYNWSNGITNGLAFSPTTTVTYTVTGTDANTCSNTAFVTVTVNPLPPVIANASSTAICIGGTVALTGGGASTYTWANSTVNGASFSPTVTNTYSVTGTNAATGCTNTAVKTITVNVLPVVTANATNPVICKTTTTTLNGGGATTYSWTGGVTNGLAFSPTTTTNYSVTGTDVNTCTNTAVASVTVNNLPNVTAGTSSSIICSGAMVALTGSGANTYTWTGGITDGTAFTPTITATYTVTGIDLNNCFNTAVTSVTVNNLPTLTANTNHSVVCSGDAVLFTGSGALTYTWTGTVLNGIPYVPSFSDSYTVAGTDFNGCIGTASTSVNVNLLPLVTASASSPVICLTSTTSLYGGGAVSYSWTGGVINGSVISPTISNTYTVTGTDANGCKNTATQLITVNALPVITANASDPVICRGESAVLNGGGANSYVWTGGAFDGLPFSPTLTATYTVTGTDINNCTNTAVTSVTVSNTPTITTSVTNSAICDGNLTTLTATGAVTYTWSGIVTDGVPFAPSVTDTYTVTGTGVNGCTNTAVRSITVYALPPVTANASHSVICLNYTTSLTGGGAITYTWSNGMSNASVFSPTLTTTYTVTGTDVHGCVNFAVQTITVNPLPVIIPVSSSPVICAGETATLAGSGANTYTWTNPVLNGVPFSPTITTSYTVIGTDLNTCSNTAVTSIIVNSTPTVIALVSSSVICKGYYTTLHGAGALAYAWTGGIFDGVPFTPSLTTTFTVTGTSIDGCTNTAITSVTVHALPLVVAAVSNSSICNGSSTTFTASGANTYTWSNGIINTIPFTPTANATYTVAGTDLNGCINTGTVSVVLNAVPVIHASTTQSTICSGDSVTLSGSGANSYTWTNGVTDGSAFSPTVTNTYTLIGSTGGCLSSNHIFITVTVNPLPSITLNSGTICVGNSFTLSASGALTYTYSSGPVITPSSTTNYSVTGTSAEGCINTVPAISTVVVNALPVINLSALENTLCSGNSTSINATGASSYLWNNGSSGASIFVQPISSTVYSVTGTDLNLCTATNTLLITVVIQPTVSISSNVNSICKGGEIILSASGADSYSWSSGSTTSVITESPDINTSFTVTGTNGLTCSSTKTIAVTVYSLPIINAGADIEINAGETYQFSVEQNGAVLFHWASNEGLSDPNILNPVTNIDHDITYTITASSVRGCLAKDEIAIKIKDGLTIANYMSPNGDGKNDTWKISNLHLIKSFSIEIVDSWGKTVFLKTDSYTNEFDASDLPDGVYYYFIKDGTQVKYKGSITVTR